MVLPLTVYSIYLYNEEIKYNAKTAKMDYETNIIDAIESTNYLLDLIDRLIDNEVAHVLKEQIQFTNRGYNFINIDKDVETVAKSVYNGLHPKLLERLTSDDSIINRDFIMTYIIEKSSIVLLYTTKDMDSLKNNKIR
jgi:hypothetical protein